MENNDLIKEKILSLEDFQNVDSELMQIISQNEEYQRLFLEYKEISRLAKESAPTPQKNGVSLRQAVMNRVKNGDVAPKYINTSKFRFPFATAASLCVVIAVVLLMKNGYLPQNSKDLSNINVTSQKSTSQTESVADNSNNAYFAPNNSSQTESEETETGEQTDTFSVQTHISNPTDDSGEIFGKSQTPQTFMVYDDSNVSNGSNNSESAKLQDSMEISKESEKSEKEQSNSELKSTAPASKSSAAGGGSAPNVRSHNAESDTLSITESAGQNVENSAANQDSQNEEVQKLISLAKELGATEVINSQLISALGEQKFVEWFQSISQSPNFNELYTSENFKKYCQNNP